MTTIFALLSVIAGFFLLIKGADWLVEGSSSIARRIGISDLVIGLTIVSFGTSAPELLVNIFASLRGSADIAIGNIVGSNISNTLLILGTTAIIAPLAVQKSTVFKEIPFCLLAALVLFFMANDTLVDGYALSELGRGDGIVFMGFFIIFMYYTFGIRKNNVNAEDGHTKAKISKWLATGLILLGLAGLTIGGEFTVRGAVQLAKLLGLSEAFIGLTIVALGTSLPELSTSIIAALKGKSDIAVGNIIGSNIFNIFWILGISSVIRPLPFNPELINVDLLVVVASTIALFIFIHTGHIPRRVFLWWKQKDGHMLSRPEGIMLLSSYVAYIVFVSWRG